MILRRPISLAVLLTAALPLSAVLVAGCQQQDASTPTGPTSQPPGSMGGPGGPGGPGGGQGRMGGGGMRGGAPLADNASGAEIYQAKCGCHGTEGAGGRAPMLTNLAGDSDDSLFNTIHDGKDKKMPAFAGQLKDEQIKKVVAYLKQLKPK